jgi:hypothetical protein
MYPPNTASLSYERVANQPVRSAKHSQTSFRNTTTELCARQYLGLLSLVLRFVRRVRLL